MTRVHQLVVSASPGDAVTDSTLAARRVLDSVGSPSLVGAKYWDPTLHGEVLSLDDLVAAADPGDVLIYHAAIGEPGIVAYLQRWDGPLVLQYHNMTPASFFAGVDLDLAMRLEEGRLELVQLLGRVDAAIADSAYNAAELEAMGYTGVRVVPLLIDGQDLLGVEPSASTLHHFEVAGGPMLLYVGQLYPHKRPDLLLRAYHLLVTYHRPDVHLVMAGPQRIPAYADHLRRLVFELGLGRCWIAGRVSGGVLAAMYRSASVVVTASEHEGVCLPLVEAMSFGVPIVARACAAIPETLGRAGLLLPEDDDPGLLCEALLAVLEDHGLCSTLVDEGTRRLRELQPEAAGDDLLRALAEAL